MEKRLSLDLVFGALFLATMFVIASAHFDPAMAATITVTTTDDSGAGSLRDAIASASSGDTINFGVTGTITLTTGQLLISKDLTITGPGVSRLAISGNNASRVFNITAGTVTISGVTIQDGNVPTGQGAGGILNWGTLTLNDVIVKSNTVNCTASSDVGGAICNGCGPGIGTLTIINSTIGENTADRGGGIFSNSTLSLINSAISGNAARVGGGILIYGTATLTNVTISGNTAANNGGAITNNGTTTLMNLTISANTAASTLGGGINNNDIGTITLRNTIVANSPSGGNCNGTITSNGHNLSSDNTCGFTGTGDLNNTDPLLGPLQDNGGPTFTQALLPGSPAIDAGDPVNFPSADQRGAPRPQRSGPDIGAYEWTPVNPFEGTIGTVMTISGSEFGAKKGKVIVGGASLKILGWTGDSIQCVLSRALQPDTYDVTIQPQAKGSSPKTIPNGFTAKAPEIDSVEPASGSVGDKISINGYYFGTKKGKVSLDGKSCKVLSWSMDSAIGESQIRFVVPRGLSSGTYELEVTVTAVGSDTVNFTVD